MDKLDKKKEEKFDKIEKCYFDLVDELKKESSKCKTLSGTKKLPNSVKKEIKKIKTNIDNFKQNIMKNLLNEEIYDLTKKNCSNNREFINNSMRDFKNQLLSNKGFEIELKEFCFPSLNGIYPPYQQKR